MAICPKCQSTSDAVLDPCPNEDGYFCIDEEEYYSHSDDRLLGREIDGRYIVQSLLGRGSMARVYKAHQGQVDRSVALKIFRPETLLGHADKQKTTADDRRQAEERFVREAKVLGKLSHPNCVTVYDFGVDGADDLLYMAMEFVGGVSLRRAVRRGLKLGAIIEIARQVLEALREAHSLEIVHRDLKPENILLTFRYSSDEQVVKVLDFGIAKLLRADSQRRERGELFGTPAYMSPEQCQGDGNEVGPSSDIYAFGCVLFEMVCGRLPYQADSPRAMVEKHIEDAVPEVAPRSGLELPDGFEDFIRRCLQKDPEARYDSAHEAYIALEELVTGSDEAFGSRLNVSGAQDMKRGSSDPSREVEVPTNALTGAEIDPLSDEEDEGDSAAEESAVQSGTEASGELREAKNPADRSESEMHSESQLGSEAVVETAPNEDPSSGDTAVKRPDGSLWQRIKIWVEEADSRRLGIVAAVAAVSFVSLLLLYLILTSITG